jgi:hypothetical protein
MAFQETAYRGAQRTISTAVAGLVGGAVAFALSEPYNNYIDTTGFNTGSVVDIIVSVGFWFALILIGIGGAVTTADAVVNRDWAKARFLLIRAAPFLVVGGIVSGFVAQIAYQNLVDFDQVSRAFDRCFAEGDDICRDALFAQIPGRAIGWGIAGMLGGIPIGLAASSKKLAQNGAVGGLIGGLIGGAVFDPIGIVFTSGTGGVARFVGVVIIGTLIGIAFSVITTARTTAFVEVLNGDFAGTQFPITDDVMLVGCANNTAITLRGDRDVKEHHFELRWDGADASFACVRNSPMIEVDGTPSSAGQIPLGAIIKVGRTELRIQAAKGALTSGGPRRGSSAPPAGPKGGAAAIDDKARPNITTRDVPRPPTPKERPSSSTRSSTDPSSRPSIPIKPPESDR